MQTTAVSTGARQRNPRSKLLLFLSVLGPGLVVMLADTDAGSIITAAQSGSVWGYRLLGLQFLLIPILYIAQELTVRLGLVTRMGHGELIKWRFGSFWAWVSISTLIISCVGAIISEFSGIAGVGMMFGVPVWVSVSLCITFLALVAWTGSYRSVERIAIMLGLFELVFFVVAWRAHPSLNAMLNSFTNIPFGNHQYLYLVAANIGAVIMPWMIFYQQSAVIDKGLTTKHIKASRWDTAIGAILTQCVMIAVLITTAATIGQHHPGTELNTVQEISNAITPYVGAHTGKLLFGLGMIGAAMVAAIVVSLTAAWGLGELLGYKRSLSDEPQKAPWFYAVYTLVLIAGGLIVLSGINIIRLNVAIEVMNALLLPIVLGFLFLLARKTLPPKYQLKNSNAWVVGIVLLITSGFGVFGGITGLF